MSQTEIYEYKKINVSLEPKPSIEAAANRWGLMGWRTVGIIAGDRPKGYADVILVERKKEDGEFEQTIREDQARVIAADVREEFPPSDIADYIEREFGGKKESDGE